jgi:hypothetical protein
MSHPARGPARSVGIDGQVNAASLRRSTGCVPRRRVEEAV